MRIGSLFSGYGGLDIAVQNVVGGDLAFVSDIEPAACRVLEAHHPGVPNLGDITAVNWQYVKHDHGPIDVLTGGYPCQPFSHAGKRKGTNDERHLWPHVRRAIRVLRPRITVLENVRGHLTLGFDTVLADLAELGMSARWGTVRAADAGAPHSRTRLFIVATQDATCWAGGAGPRWGVPEPEGAVRPAAPDVRHPAADSGSGPFEGSGATRHGLPVAAERGDVDWGKYGPAIARWESILGRPAPAPTVMDKRLRLNPVFVEWLMGLNEGHVTGHGLRPAQELKMLGNGVVPQQAALALRMLLADEVSA